MKYISQYFATSKNSICRPRKQSRTVAHFWDQQHRNYHDHLYIILWALELSNHGNDQMKRAMYIYQIRTSTQCAYLNQRCENEIMCL